MRHRAGISPRFNQGGFYSFTPKHLTSMTMLIKHLRPLLLLLLAALTLTLQAQHVKFKVGGGLATHYGHDHAVGAYKIGMGYEWELGQHLSITPWLEVAGKGWKTPDAVVQVRDDAGEPVFDDETGEPLTGIMSRSTTANYLELPILLTGYLRLGPSRYLVLAGGPYVAWGVAGKSKVKGDQEQSGSRKLYYDEKTFDRPGAHRFDAGLQAFAGYQFQSGITVGIEADFGWAKCSAAGGRNLSSLLTLGYHF